MSTKNVKFYDNYHRKNSYFFRVIDDNNFTYFHLLPIIKLATSKFRGKEKAIDVGCGVGTLAFYLANSGIDTTGFDVSARAINICKKYLKYSGFKNIRFKREDIEKLRGKNEYDLILCTEVIEHLENDQRFVDKLFMLTKKNGKLIVSTPSLHAPLYRLGLLRNFDRNVGHLRRYTKDNLIELLEKSGFEVINSWEVEGILRNSLYTLPMIGILLKVIRGPMITLFHKFDQLSVSIFGESDIIVLAQKK